jgi:large subunit ribosomal protein L22
MEVTAISRFVKMSPSKARGLARKLRGLPVDKALNVVEFSPKKAGRIIGKTLRSAIANAQNNAKLPLDDLRVKCTMVEEGPRARRYWARARGMVSPISRKMCHIRVILTDGKESEET